MELRRGLAAAEAVWRPGDTWGGFGALMGRGRSCWVTGQARANSNNLKVA